MGRGLAMNHRSSVLFWLTLGCGIFSAAGHAQIVIYSFTSSSTAPTSVAANLSGGSVSTGGGVTTTSSTSPVSSGYTGASGGYFISDNSWTGASPGVNYFQFTVTPVANFTVSLTSLSFGYRESGTSTGPTAFAVRSSSDSYAADLAVGALTNSDNTWHSSGNTSVTLTFTSATTFRIYASGAASATPTLRMDDLTLNGSVAAVPEPTTVAAALGLAALGAAWRRRRSSRLLPDRCAVAALRSEFAASSGRPRRE